VIGYLASYAESAAHVATITAKLEEEKRKIEAEKKYGEADVKQAMAKRDQTAAPTKYELESQTAKIDQLTAQLTFQQWNVERTKGLSLADSVSEKEYKQLDSDLLAKQAELASAKAGLEKTKATSAADTATSNAMISLAMMGLEKSLVSSTILSLEREKKEAEEKAERKIIRAPISAQVLRIIIRPGETVGKDPILHIGDTRNMHALAEIYETEVDRIHVGQKALIESPIFVKPLTGVVSQIGLAVYQSDIDNDDPANPKDARVVQVRIKLDNALAASRYSNLQVRCKIELERNDAKSNERAPEPTP
jgi:HlyD family secretion protein